MVLNPTKYVNHTRAVGNVTEDIACQYLKKNGLILITKNFSQRIGEIDLIMKHENVIVFIEVRYRKNINYGYPEETVTLKKQKKIKATALLFIAKNSEFRNTQPRFDVVAMRPDNNGDNMSINWIQNAF
ncbi:MAG: YraN family protein [Thiohalomonadales bacterium]